MEPTISEQVTEAVEETVEDIVVADEAKAVEEAVEELTEAIPSLSEESTHSLENLEDEVAITELAMYLTNISNELNALAMVRYSAREWQYYLPFRNRKTRYLNWKTRKSVKCVTVFSASLYSPHCKQ